MFTKNNNLNVMTLTSCFDSMTLIACPKLANSHIFINPFSLNVTLFWEGPYFTAHIKINYETGCIRRLSEKTQRYIQDHRGS